MGTHDEKATAAEADKAADTGTTTPAAAASGAGTTATATTATVTKAARPKTAAEIVAEVRAREKAAAETPAGSPAVGTGAAGSEAAAPEAGKATAGSDPAATSVTKPVGKVPAGAVASSNKSAGLKGSGKGKQALTSVGSGVRKLRNLIASLIWLAAVLAAAVLALGALFTALDQTNQSNEIVRWILERGHDLVGPFKDLFRLETAKNTLLVNWGIAALVYLIAGKIIERFVRP